MPTKHPRVSIIIPTRNRYRDLVECIDSLRNLDYPKETLEVIVWDNYSKDESSKIVKELYEEMASGGWLNLALIESDINIGPYLPYNRLQNELNPDSEYFLGLDDDVLLDKYCLAHLVEVIRTVPRAAVVGCRGVYYDDPARTSSCAGFVNWWLGRFRTQDFDIVVECDYVIGCCWLIKRDLFVELGGFDQDYFTMHWEIDFCARARSAGYNTFYQPRALVRHKTSPTKRSGLYYLFRNKILLIRRNAPLCQQITSFSLYLLFWLPKLCIDSVIANRGFKWNELFEILEGVLHGFWGITGRNPKY